MVKLHFFESVILINRLRLHTYYSLRVRHPSSSNRIDQLFNKILEHVMKLYMYQYLSLRAKNDEHLKQLLLIQPLGSSEFSLMEAPAEPSKHPQYPPRKRLHADGRLGPPTAKKSTHQKKSKRLGTNRLKPKK